VDKPRFYKHAAPLELRRRGVGCDRSGYLFVHSKGQGEESRQIQVIPSWERFFENCSSGNGTGFATKQRRNQVGGGMIFGFEEDLNGAWVKRPFGVRLGRLVGRKLESRDLDSYNMTMGRGWSWRARANPGCWCTGVSTRPWCRIQVNPS
jgi:hypothetical protein